MPDHSTFSKNRHGRFRDSDLLRRLFETTVERCMAEGLVGGEGFAVDASLIRADANRQTGGPGSDGLPPDAADAMVFHAGTAEQDGRIVTAGGRVLCVVGLGDSIKLAQKQAYEVVDQIHFAGMQCRRDIGWRGLKH